MKIENFYKQFCKEEFDKNGLLSSFEPVVPEGFNFARRQQIRIVTGITRGLGVPRDAIRVITESDGTAVSGVYTFHRNNISFVRLYERDFLGQLDGYNIYREPEADQERTNRLVRYSDVIIGGKNLYDGKVLR